MSSSRSAHLARTARTYLYRALTNATPAQLEELQRRPSTALPMALVGRVVHSGPLVVAEGPGRGLLIDGERLPVAYVQGFSLVRGLLEVPVQEALRRTVREGSVVYDVGASLGFFTLLAARLTGPSGRVEAFEPLPASADAVRANAALNELHNVRVHQAALGRTTGPAEFLRVAEPSQSHLRDRGWHADTKEVLQVDVHALDDLVAAGSQPAPDVIKLDVEGSEIAVLEGARRVLREHRPVIVCELHETNREVLELLDDWGYGVENLDGAVPVLDAGPTHVLAAPRAQPSVRAGQQRSVAGSGESEKRQP